MSEDIGTSKQKVLGGFELVSFPEFKIQGVIAKVDTGAYTGALHATKIQEGLDDKGQQQLNFHPLGKDGLSISTTNYHKKMVRSSNGYSEERFVVNTIIEIDGAPYPIRITLSDRSNMMKEVLLGRRFLRKNHFLVDVRKGTEYAYAVKE